MIGRFCNIDFDFDGGNDYFLCLVYGRFVVCSTLLLQKIASGFIISAKVQVRASAGHLSV
jgi:hypothetical protein